MAKKKVVNNNRFNVGLKLMDGIREVLIRPNSFVYLDEEEIHYLNSVSRLFRNGVLYCEDEEMMQDMGYTEKNPNVINEDEIKEMFKLSANKLKTELEKITAQHAIDKIIAVAKESDLPTSKLKVIKEVYGIEIFEEVEGNIV
jgi:hypothetical protein